jgi:surface protein
MNSLEELNAYSKTSISVTDERLANVIFDRSLEYISARRGFEIYYDGDPWEISIPGRIEEVINWETTECFYQLEFFSDVPSVVANSSFTFAGFPSTLDFISTPTGVIVRYFKTRDEWLELGALTWIFPSNFASASLYFAKIKVSWFDAELGSQRTLSFEIYDPEYYYQAALNSEFSLKAAVPQLKQASANLESSFILRPDFVIGLNVVATVNANVTVKPPIRITANLTTTTGFNLVDESLANFRLVINPTLGEGNEIILPMSENIGDSSVDFTINWGDGSSETYTGSTMVRDPIHTYSNSSVRAINILGSFKYFGRYNRNGTTGTTLNSPNAITEAQRLENVKKFTACTSFGIIPWASTGLVQAFRGNSNLTTVPSILPTQVTQLTSMFEDCTTFNSPNVSNWNTINITLMNSMFQNATNFNQPISTWNTVNVTNTQNMFDYAYSFNQPIGTWNTGNVTNMDSMFRAAIAFNQPIGTWNTGKVVSMQEMFAGKFITIPPSSMSFNQSISTWNTSNVTTMRRMFIDNYTFNSSIANWNTGKVTDMSEMFWFALAFNQPIGNFNVSNVLNTSRMFLNAQSFNQPIGNWNTGKVTNMSEMFRNAEVFNQPIGNWNVSKVTNMNSMFSQSFTSSTSFDQDISGWCVSLIPTQPTNFALNGRSTWTSAEKPVWGTCP